MKYGGTQKTLGGTPTPWLRPGCHYNNSSICNHWIVSVLSTFWFLYQQSIQVSTWAPDSRGLPNSKEVFFLCCNNIPSFLQRTAPITQSFCEGCTWHDLHIVVTAPLCCDAESVQRFTLWHQATMGTACRAHSIIYCYGRNFVAKCGGTAWCETNIFIRAMLIWSFINTDSQSCF